MALNLHHLELFYYVARHRGLASAVRHIPYGIQEPAVSRQIQALERSLGVCLFERRPFRLTPGGETLFEFIRFFFDRLDDLECRVRARQATIRIGACEPILRDYLPPVIARVRRRAPDLPFVLRALTRSEILRGFADRAIDLALAPLASCDDASLARRRIASVAPVLVVPRTFSEQEAETWWQPPVAAQPLMTPLADEPVTQSFAAGLRARGLAWPVSFELGAIALITHFAARGDGIGLTVDVPGLVQHPGVRRVPLPDFTPVDIFLVWRTPPSREQSLLLEELGREITPAKAGAT